MPVRASSRCTIRAEISKALQIRHNSGKFPALNISVRLIVVEGGLQLKAKRAAVESRDMM
jgi:hypothetical protein